MSIASLSIHPSTLEYICHEALRPPSTVVPSSHFPAPGSDNIDPKKDGEKPERPSTPTSKTEPFLTGGTMRSTMELPKLTNQPALRRLVSSLRRSRPSNTHSRQSHLFHRASFPPLSRVEPILLIPTPTPLPPLPYSPSPASLSEQIAFINLRTSSRAVPAPQPAYPPSHPFSARARLSVGSFKFPPRAVAVNRG
ncbi:hypothetical protein JB92DRAFT_3122447 [Gautieria morchelliformis]|nr:hypothetical protein JB92DRAFT_3122447 [Gautieria morchelliformis]